MSSKNDVVSSTKWTAISTVTSAIATVAVFAALARILEPAEMGLVSLLIVVVSFVEVFLGLGLPGSLIHHRLLTSRQKSSVHWVIVCFNVVIALMLGITAPLIAGFFAQPDLAAMIAVFSLSLVVTGFGLSHKALMEKRLRFRSVSIGEISYFVLLVIASVGLAWVGFGAISYVLAVLVGSIARSVIWICGSRTTFIPRIHLSWEEFRGFLSFGIYQALDGVSNFTSNNISSVSLGRLLGPAPLAGFTLSFQIGVQMPGRVNPIITRVLFPYLAAHSGDQDRTKRAFLLVNQVCVLVVGPALILVGILASDVMTVLYGSAYSDYGRVLTILCAVGIIRAYGNPLGAMLAATGSVRLGFWLNLARAIISVPLVFAMTAFAGVDGAAWGMLLTGILGFAVGSIASRAVLGVTFWTYVRKLISAIATCVPLFLSGWAVSALLPSEMLAFWRILFVGTASALVYLTTLTLARSYEPITWVWSLLQRRS